MFLFFLCIDSSKFKRSSNSICTNHIRRIISLMDSLQVSDFCFHEMEEYIFLIFWFNTVVPARQPVSFGFSSLSPSPLSLSLSFSLLLLVTYAVSLFFLVLMFSRSIVERSTALFVDARWQLSTEIVFSSRWIIEAYLFNSLDYERKDESNCVSNTNQSQSIYLSFPSQCYIFCWRFGELEETIIAAVP